MSNVPNDFILNFRLIALLFIAFNVPQYRLMREATYLCNSLRSENKNFSAL